MKDWPGRRALLVLTLQVTASYLLLVSIPALSDFFTLGYRAVFEQTVERLPIRSRLSLHLVESRRPGIDAYISVTRPGEREESFPIDIRNPAYVATALVVSLATSLPVAWRRRALALVVSLSLLWSGFLVGLGSSLWVAFGDAGISPAGRFAFGVLNQIVGQVPWYLLSVGSCSVGLVVALLPFGVGRPEVDAPGAS